MNKLDDVANLINNSYGNPFYSNYIFTSIDLKRITIKWWQYPLLYFKRTYVQISDGHVWYYKKGSDGCIYLIKQEGII